AIGVSDGHLRSTIIPEPNVCEAPDGCSCGRICCRILVGASLGFYAEELALMKIKKSSAALRIGAFGKHVASHARSRSFRDVLSLLRLENKQLDLSSGAVEILKLNPYRDRCSRLPLRCEQPGHIARPLRQLSVPSGSC